MKRLFTLIALFAVMLGAVAQTENVYLWKNGVYTAHPLSSIDSITFVAPGNPNDNVTVVDLGLPSGTLWADRNVGADSPEDYGDYFAWGETESKSSYDWNTYKWSNASYDSMTKYCPKSSYGYNGFKDYKTTLDFSDDAAYVNMGSSWRMPTKADFQELIDKCIWTWTTLNGKKGFKVTGPSGESIFLPAAGWRSGSTLSVAGSYGLYWSSSLNENIPHNAYYLDFGSEDYHSLYDLSRSNGHTVRAVVR